MSQDWTENMPADVLLEADALGAPDWLSDEECLHEIGSDWSRRHCANTDMED